jgi:hypothetical protein
MLYRRSPLHYLLALCHFALIRSSLRLAVVTTAAVIAATVITAAAAVVFGYCYANTASALVRIVVSSCSCSSAQCCHDSLCIGTREWV